MTTQGEASTGSALRARAAALIDVGRAEEAARLLGDRLAEQPQDAASWSLLAAARLQGDDPSGALSAAESALALEPDQVVSLQRRAHALLALQRYPEALATAERAVACAPQLWGTHYTAGLVLRQLPGRGPDAMLAARRAVELAPDQADPHVLFGLTQSDAGLTDNAVAAYRRALEIDPEHGWARSNLSVVDLRRNDYQRAMAGFRAAAGTAPQVTTFHRNMATTALAPLLRYGYWLALAVVTGVRILVRPILFPTDVTGSVLLPGINHGPAPATGYVPGPVPPVHPAWPLGIGLSITVVLMWAVFLVIRLRPLDRYLRRLVWQVFGDIIRNPARAGIIVVAIPVSQALIIVGLALAAVSESASVTTIGAAFVVLFGGTLLNLLITRLSKRSA